MDVVIGRTDDSVHINTGTISGDILERDRPDTIPHKHFVIFKFVLFVLLVSFVFLAKVYFVPSVSVKCLNDPLHKLLSFINDQVNTGNSFARIL